MKSKKNILSITITIVLCLVFVAYGLVLAYHTNIKRNASREVNTVTTENSLLSNSIGTTEKKSGLVLQNTAFSNVQPIVTMPNHSVKNKFEFNVVKAQYSYENISSTETNSRDELYLEGTQAYIYTMLHIDENLPSSIVDDYQLNKILPTDFQVTFYMDGFPIGVCATEDGGACWDKFTKWYIDETHHTAKCTLDENGFFYVAVRVVLYNAGNHDIRVEYKGNTLDEFTINVKSEDYFKNVKSFKDIFPKEDADSNFLRSSSYASKHWSEKYENGFSFITNNTHNFEWSSPKDKSNYKLSPGSTIEFNPEVDFPQLHDFKMDNNKGYYSNLNTAFDLKILLIYPSGDDAPSDLISLEKGTYGCNCDPNHDRYYQFKPATHTIPSDWNKEEYKVTVVFFNEWCPKGQFYWTMTYTYKVDLVSIDVEETEKQADLCYTENSEIYTYLVLDYKGTESTTKGMSAEFTITNNGVLYILHDGSKHVGTGIDNLSSHGKQCYEDYTKGNKISGRMTNADGSQKKVVYLSLRWVTPEVYPVGGSNSVNIKIKLFNNGKTIGEESFNINVYDNDCINEYKNMADKYGNNLDLTKYFNRDNVLEFEDATKNYYDNYGRNGILSNNLNAFYQTCLTDFNNVDTSKEFKNSTKIQVEFDNGKKYGYSTYFFSDETALDSINNSNSLLDYNAIFNSNNKFESKAGGSIGIPISNTDDTKSKLDSKDFSNDEKVVLLYPEYGYNVRFGDLLTIEDYKNNTSYKFEPTMLNPNLTITNTNHQHTIPLWWNENEDYVVVAIYFGKFTPLGQLYYAEKITYDVQGSVYGDWYITRNKG